MQVEGDPALLASALERMVSKKSRQLARVIDATPNVPNRGYVVPPTNSALFRDKEDKVRALLIGARAWYADRFGELGDDDRALAWERTPVHAAPVP